MYLVGVHFSCKITSSVLTFFERSGGDIATLLDATDLPEEFLHDPNYWMPADEMERFLGVAQKMSRPPSFAERAPGVEFPEDILVQIGHATTELRVWGVLDSVLRMMPFQDVLAQPSRFLSYFVSPEPPVEKVKLTGETSGLDQGRLDLNVPIPQDRFPLTCQYLRAAFEMLPVFGGKPKAVCEWTGTRLSLVWSAPQEDIFKGADLGHQMSPDLMREIVIQLEAKQRELQQRNLQLEKDHLQLRASYQVLEQKAEPEVALASAFGGRNQLLVEVARMGDYMVRAQQLITLLIGNQKAQPAIQEAMKRVDWEWVKVQYPVSVETCRKILQGEAVSENRPQIERGSHV